ncbi:MAG: protein-L-isoaspartate(D-aspartate) O-methyltransferase [Planctomycetia bacterium]|nr:protein-L-isoaspartate(D-aspartate) O-methyltransferase [Planctomycetia bacterium]
MPPAPPDPLPGAAIARQVRDRGVTDPRVLDALARVSRAWFLPDDQRPFADDDRAIPIGCDQTVSQPYMVAVMTAELVLTGRERVLEIGTGSGYQTAVLAALASDVYTVERHATLSLRARGRLDGLGLTNVHYRTGDGSLGWPEEAPFDRVLVTAATPAFPVTLFSQLGEEGLLVAPLGGDDGQTLTVVRKQNGRAVIRELFSCRFVPLIGAEGWGGG